MNTHKILSNCLVTALFFVSLTIQGALFASPTWQDDPFDPFATGDPDVQVVAPGGQDDGAEISLDESLSEGVVLVIKAVRESQPSTPIELSRAIKTMMTVGQFDEAKRYLDQLVGLDPDASQMFDLSEAMGPAFFLDLRSQPELQPRGKEFADLVFKSSNTEAFEPNRIGQLITELSDDNKFVRQAAFRKLKQLGGPAVSVMLEVCEDQGRRREIPFVSSALKQMGPPALFPLIGAARADGTVAQAVAAGALSSIDSSLAVDALLRMSISSRVPESVRAIAAEAISRRGFVSQDEIENRIHERANDYLDGKVTIPSNATGQSTIWNWNFANGKLMATITSESDAVRIMSVDLARDLYNLNPGNLEYRKLQLLTVLEATKRVLGPNRSIRLNEVTTFVSDLSQNDINVALEDSLQRMLVPAAVGAAELAGQTGDVSILFAPNGEHSTLVQAVLSGHRQVQFAAAKAIADLDPQQQYPGCSYVAKFLAMIANSAGNSAAVAVHPKQDSAQALATSIFQTGRIGLTANSGIQLFDMINNNPDIDFLVITDTIARPHYQELVQQIRKFWLSQHMPIALLTRTDERERRAKLIFDNDPLTLVLPYANNARTVSTQVARLLQLLPLSSVSSVQRELQSEFAMNWLAKVLSQPEIYGFYQISRFRNQLSQLVRLPGSYKVKSDILAGLGTPRSQKALADLASDLSLSTAQRQFVASAFGRSIKRNGLLLTRLEIQIQYDRYNASQSASQEVQNILGSILDSIETKTMPMNESVSGR